MLLAEMSEAWADPRNLHEPANKTGSVPKSVPSGVIAMKRPDANGPRAVA